jgi:hypothetical protein
MGHRYGVLGFGLNGGREEEAVASGEDGGGGHGCGCVEVRWTRWIRTSSADMAPLLEGDGDGGAPASTCTSSMMVMR